MAVINLPYQSHQGRRDEKPCLRQSARQSLAFHRLQQAQDRRVSQLGIARVEFVIDLTNRRVTAVPENFEQVEFSFGWLAFRHIPPRRIDLFDPEPEATVAVNHSPRRDRRLRLGVKRVGSLS